MKSTHHCFSIANQYFVMEEDLFDYFHKLAEGARRVMQRPNANPLVFELDVLDRARPPPFRKTKPIASFGLNALNSILGGVYPGLNYAIGTAPGKGKTTLALQEADQARGRRAPGNLRFRRASRAQTDREEPGASQRRQSRVVRGLQLRDPGSPLSTRLSRLHSTNIAPRSPPISASPARSTPWSSPTSSDW